MSVLMSHSVCGYVRDRGGREREKVLMSCVGEGGGGQ